MLSNNLPKGKLGEDIATNYLQKKGYRIIARNFKARYEELDIIATFQKTLIFVEVKTRWGTPYGTPAEAVTSWKLKSLIKAAEYYKLLNPTLPDLLRMDVVAIQLDSFDHLISLEHIENITS